MDFLVETVVNHTELQIAIVSTFDAELTYTQWRTAINCLESNRHNHVPLHTRLRNALINWRERNYELNQTYVRRTFCNPQTIY